MTRGWHSDIKTYNKTVYNTTKIKIMKIRFSKEIKSFMSSHGLIVSDHGEGILNISTSLIDSHARDHIAHVVAMLLELNKNLRIATVSIDSYKLCACGAIVAFNLVGT